jgi:hypothetical protein
MTASSLHFVVLSCRVSGRQHGERTDESVRFMAANLSLVGMRSCSALYHVDFILSAAGLACRFFHTWFQAVRGNFLTNLILVSGLAFIASMCKVLYIRRLKSLLVSLGAGGGAT